MSNDGDLGFEESSLQELVESERRHRDLLDNLQIAVVEHAADTSIVFCNRLALKMLGLEKDAATGRIAADPRWVLRREDGSEMPLEEFPVVQVLNTLQPIRSYVVGVEKPDSKGIVWALVDAFPRFDERNSLKRVVVSFLDITESRRMQKALRESDAKRAAMLANISDVIGIIGVDGITKYVSPNVEKWFGWKPEDLVGTDGWATVHPDDLERIHRVFSMVLAGDSTPWTVEYRYKCKDGSYKPIEWTAVDLTKDTAISGVLINYQDITERRMVQKVLRESEERHRNLIEHSPYCIHEIDLEGRLISMNAAGLKMMGVDDVCLVKNMLYTGTVGSRDRARIADLLDGALAGQAAEFTFQASNGLEFQSVFVPISDDLGNVRRIMGITTDITDRKQAEAEKESLERQIQQAQKLESLGVLAGGIAHDFNNILTAILGNAELALYGLSPHSPARDNIKEIEKASTRAGELAKQMLAYSGRGQFVIEPIDLNEFVEEMAHLLDVSITKKAVLRYNFADNLPTFDGDATQIRQIIMNLIINASEAIGDRSGVIALSTGAMRCDRSYLQRIDPNVFIGLEDPLVEDVYVYLEVADTGSGMDAETIEKIFDPFFSTKFTGRGLGLSATLGIVRGHKGAIKIYSEVSKGTTFKILFPTTMRPDRRARLGQMDRQTPTTWRGQGTVLVVDDEETVRAVGRQMVECMGFTGLTASDGREAVEVFREHSADIVCVLLDLTMPHMDGEEAFRELRRIRDDVNVILCSGYNMQDATQSFTGKGLAGFIQKPYKMESLRDRLRLLLGDSGETF